MRLSRLIQFFGVRRTIGSSILAAFIALRILDPAPIENLRLRGFDIYQTIKPRVATQRPVVIVDIDEASLAALGQWPWPRTLIADLAGKLQQRGALVIGFDIIFSEPDRMSPALAVNAFRGLDEATRSRLQSLPSNDQVLADVMRSGKVVLGQSGLHVAAQGSEQNGLPHTGFAVRGPDPSAYVVTFDGLLRNVPVLEQAAAGRGLLSIRPEKDGIVRRAPMIMKAAGAFAPALSLEMLRVASGSPAILLRSDAAGLRSVGMPRFEVPTDQNGQLWINFAPHDAARFVSAKDVLQDNVPADRFTQRLVLIGTSAVGLLDLKPTPIEAAMPGVEIHAQILENVLTGAVLSYPSYAKIIELLAVLLTGIAIVIVAPMIAALPLLALGAAAGTLLVAAAWYFFVQHSVLLDVTFPLLSSFTIYVALVFTSYFREQRDRRRIRSAFSQYISPALVEQLAQSPKKLVLGGEDRDMTIMFSDVRGFTSISETFKHDPQGLTQLMNRLLTPLTNAIIDRKGTIDKYMGDAIMAFWNAPLDDSAHEENACYAALDMLDRIAELNTEREREAAEQGHRFVGMNMGIGINTGACVVGNMGSDLRFDYSVLGDPVNLASRLEGRSKSYGTAIILGSNTAAKVHPKFALLEIDLITVKGKTEPEHIYTMLGRDDVLRREEFRQLQDFNAAMLTCYRKRDWPAAADVLARAEAAYQHFGLGEICQLYRSRVETFRMTPPPDDWNGVFASETK